MGITPLEIRKKEFGKKIMGGVDPVEVKTFLEQVAEDFERHVSEKSAIRTELDSIKERLASYIQQEEMIKRTLILAEKAAEETVVNAKKQAELMIEEARNKGHEIEKEFNKLRSAKERFVLEFETLLETFRRHVKEFGGRDTLEDKADEY